MRILIIFLLVLLFGFLFSQNVAAQATQSKWKWETYTGVTHWRVTVTDDETGCGGGYESDTYNVSIHHNLQIADIDDFGHGDVRGTFTGNILSIPPKTIPDGSGTSKLTEANVVFDSECSGFEGKYYWDYKDSYQACSGSTVFTGTRTDPKGCPEPGLGMQILDARADADKGSQELRYGAILEKDPKNFWANWDMAELKKKQGNYNEFFNYYNKAISNESIVQETREKLKKRTLEDLHLSEFPSRDTSPILRIEQDELKNWNGGSLYNVQFPKEEAKNMENWKIKLWGILVPNSYNIINEIVGQPKA